MAHFLGWPYINYGLENMDMEELLNWIAIMSYDIEEFKSDEQVQKEQSMKFKALKEMFNP